MIEVGKKSEEQFQVTIDERGSQTKHTVILTEQYYQKLTEGKITKEDLIKKSFQFLLNRESKESILSKFNVNVIGNYFPEYEEKIKI